MPELVDKETEKAVRVSLANCAGCLVLSFCDAHMSGGEWKHSGGVAPCVVVDS